MDIYWTACNVASCDNLVPTYGQGLVVCEPCRAAIWGDEPAHDPDDDQCPCPHH